MRKQLICALLLLFVTSFSIAITPIAAQEECETAYEQAAALLAQAQAALNTGDAEAANTFISAAQNLLAPCLPGAEETADAVETVSSNAAWSPVVRDFDGVEMVLVPPGCFMMGSTEEVIAPAIEAANDDIFENQLPQHEVCIDTAFWLDRVEVSNAQFAAFGGQAARPGNFQGENDPRENVNWLEARDYCLARGMRLPTEAEWEYAARGPDSLPFPWGSAFIPDNLTWGGNANGETSPVGSIPNGASWVGALDMSGNVFEWTSTIYDQEVYPYPYDATDGRENNSDTSSRRVFRGSSWDFFLEDVFRASYRLSNAPDYRFINIGIRCAVDDTTEG